MNYHGSIILVFTFIWICALSIMLTTRHYMHLNYTFPANRSSSLLSDIGFILTSCFLGGVTASLSGMLLRVIIYFSVDHSELLISMFQPPPTTLLTGISATILYMFILGTASYLLGLLIQVNRVFSLVIPALFIYLIRLHTNTVIINTVEFYLKESSLLLFTGKIILTSIVFCLLSMLLSHKLEVKR